MFFWFLRRFRRRPQDSGHLAFRWDCAILPVTISRLRSVKSIHEDTSTKGGHVFFGIQTEVVVVAKVDAKKGAFFISCASSSRNGPIRSTSTVHTCAERWWWRQHRLICVMHVCRSQSQEKLRFVCPIHAPSFEPEFNANASHFVKPLTTSHRTHSSPSEAMRLKGMCMRSNHSSVSCRQRQHLRCVGARSLSLSSSMASAEHCIVLVCLRYD